MSYLLFIFSMFLNWVMLAGVGGAVVPLVLELVVAVVLVLVVQVELVQQLLAVAVLDIPEQGITLLQLLAEQAELAVVAEVVEVLLVLAVLALFIFTTKENEQWQIMQL